MIDLFLKCILEDYRADGSRTCWSRTR